MDERTWDPHSAGIVGAGTMGAGIAMACANAGLDVVLFDADPAALARAGETLRATYDAQSARGKLTRAEAAGRLQRIACVADDERFDGVDVAIEAVFEDLALKARVFARLGERCSPGTLLATNTSTLDVDAIARAAARPERAIGMHFFSPAHVMRLLEIVRGAATSRVTVERAVAFGMRLGKIPVVVGNGDGFVGNRMLLGYKREAEFLVLEGASPLRVDGALERFGFAMGPFAVADLAGIDVGWRAKMERIRRGSSPPFALTTLTDALVAAGKLGQKTGGGYYRYLPGDRSPRPDQESDAIVEGERLRAGRRRVEPSDDAIVERCVYALVNEGAKILADGIAASAADIDTIWVNGYGFPRARGGPMRYAEDVGLPLVLAAIERFARSDAAFWSPAPLLAEAARRGRFPPG
jgi:3-hydroxyacyl-CoA dehydrogenase